MEPRFDAFVGIDWSGARGRSLKGLRIAMASPGVAPPFPIRPPRKKLWDRETALQWLAALMRLRHVLAGFDFAFAYPHADEGSYFPGAEVQPEDARALWAEVERACEGTPDLYGAPFYARDDLPYARHFLTHAGRGDLYRYRQRLTERACAAVTTPHPVAKCIGPANVGTGSAAGMRLLHRLAGTEGRRPSIWPFEPLEEGRSAVAEIFPRLYFARAGVDPRAWRDRAAIDAALAHYGSNPPSPNWIPESEDEADAMVSAAALRALARDREVWEAPRGVEAAERTEGWIFGVARAGPEGAAP